jgi:hypothetical protein
VATFGSRRWRSVLRFAMRLYIEDLNTRFMTLNGMEQGPAHELLDAEAVVVVFEQFLNPIQSGGFLDLRALQCRWVICGPVSARSSVAVASIGWLRSHCAPWRSRRCQRTRSPGRSGSGDQTEFAPLFLSACEDPPRGCARRTAQGRRRRKRVML